ncbi:MAG: Lrp/AsnC family transcriptional regulator [Clostridiaceae bacterium]
MDHLDEEILNITQEGIAFEHRPFKTIGEKLRISEDEVISRINNLKEQGYIRKFGGFFNSHKIGYIGTLCAMTVPKDNVDEVAEVINSYSEITHNYLRDDMYNMWFTILTRSKDETTKIVEEIKFSTGINDLISLPSKKLFKVKAAFKLGG